MAAADDKMGATPGGSAGDPAAAVTPAPPPASVTPADAAQAAERFDGLLGRLRGVVEKLESGNLSLEDSLKYFEEGIALCRRGAAILDSAERKVEILLEGSGDASRRAPFDTQAPPQPGRDE